MFANVSKFSSKLYGKNDEKQCYFILQQQRALIFKLDNILGWLTVWGHSCST